MLGQVKATIVFLIWMLTLNLKKTTYLNPSPILILSIYFSYDG